MASPPPSAVSTSFKLLVLVILALQNSGITLVTRYSRGVLKEPYSPLSAVLLSEIIKLFASIFMVSKSQSFSVSSTIDRVLHLTRSSLVMSVPGFIYLIQNQLGYIGLQNLESATYSMLSQLKLLTTAVFAVIILRKKLWTYQWRALILLFIGVTLIQSRPQTQTTATSKSSGDLWLGTLAVIGVCILSGLAGIYNEYQLKGSTSYTMWDRNYQLSMFGLIFGLFTFPFSGSDWNIVFEEGFFYGYSLWTLLAVLLASLGGLLVSAAVVYTDNILKNFATSAAILLTSLISWAIFGDLTVDANFLCGTGCVLMAVFNYNESIKSLALEMGMIEAVMPSNTELKNININGEDESGTDNDLSTDVEDRRPLLITGASKKIGNV